VKIALAADSCSLRSAFPSVAATGRLERSGFACGPIHSGCQDVRLEVLDWGGTGRPRCCCRRGDTAHVFDDFAPKLIGDFHVYGSRGRGFGDRACAGRLWRRDVGRRRGRRTRRAQAGEAILAGHAIAGQELSSIGTRFPIASQARVFRCGTLRVRQRRNPDVRGDRENGLPADAAPTDADLASFDTLRQYYIRVLGLRFRRGAPSKRSATPEGEWGRSGRTGGTSLLKA
jgi:hypothetical protein